MTIFNQNGQFSNLNQGQEMYPNNGYRNTWSNQNGFISRPNYQVLPGRVINNSDDITPQEVPMDGSVSFFPQQDYSCIYAKTWTKEGTIATLKFVPEQPQAATGQKSPLEERLDRIDQRLEALDKKLYRPRNFQKRNNPHPKKEMNENE